MRLFTLCHKNRLTKNEDPILETYNHIVKVVTVVQLVERQIVVLVVVGSSPISHPISFFNQKNQSKKIIGGDYE